MLKPLYRTLKSVPKTPKSVISISHLHTQNKTLISNPAIDFILDECKSLQSSNTGNHPIQHAAKTAESIDPGPSSSIQISPQWPEWVSLMEKLVKFGYFDSVGNPFRSGGFIDGKSCNQIRTACLSFARDRPDLMSYFTSRDIQMVAGSGCPSTDRKVVNSGKRLRAHMGINEGNVCSSCNFRGNCERAYVKARVNEGGCTADVMRFVLTYGLDRINGSDDNKQLINKKLDEAIKSLIKDMVKYSKEEHDFDPSKRVSSFQRSQSQREEHRSKIRDHDCDAFDERIKRLENNQDYVQLKKGDWLCTRCKFLNFAKNTRCLQCQTNPPKRQLNLGEWTCDSCNYINFKRNIACLKCDHKRPKALNNSTQLHIRINPIK